MWFKEVNYLYLHEACLDKKKYYKIHKKVPRLVSKFSKVAEHYVNIQKEKKKASLYIKSKQLEFCFKKIGATQIVLKK